MIVVAHGVSVKKDLVTLCNARIIAEITPIFTATLAAIAFLVLDAATVSERFLIERANQLRLLTFPITNSFAFSIAWLKAVAFDLQRECAT